MHDDHVFLCADTRIELLTARWHTWPHLLSPIQHALTLTFRQIPMIEEFLADPHAHVAMNDDPEMMGAPVLHAGTNDVQALTSLLSQLQTERAPAIQFARDVVELQCLLAKDPSGQSLEHMYSALPPSLRGLVEITRDHHNRACIRIFEELMTGSEIDPASLQEISLVRLKDAERPFFLNTPRMYGPDRFDIRVSFRDPRATSLIAARTWPTKFGDLCDALGIAESDRARFGTYFTMEGQPRAQGAPPKGSVRVRYFGHASVLLETDAVTILIDPMVTWDTADRDGHLTFDDLPDRIDYVFITHNHHDHFVPEILWHLRTRIGTVLVPANNLGGLVDPSLQLALSSLGIESIQVMRPMQTIQIPGGTLTSLPFLGEHAELSIYSKHALHVALHGRSMVFLADSRCVDRALYRRLAGRIGRVDAIFVGMECVGAPLTWMYGPYLTALVTRREDEGRRLNGSDAERAWAVVEELKPTMVYVYAMGLEPWLSHLAGLSYSESSPQILESDELISRCMNSGISARRLCGCEELEIGTSGHFV